MKRNWLAAVTLPICGSYDDAMLSTYCRYAAAVMMTTPTWEKKLATTMAAHAHNHVPTVSGARPPPTVPPADKATAKRAKT